MERVNAVSVWVATLCLAASGSTAAVAAGPAEASVRITRIAPDAGSPLRVGEEVALVAEVEYRLASGSATVTLVVQGGRGERVGTQHVEVVQKGAGTVSLKSSFKVPETTAIVVYTPLNLQGQGATSIVDSRAYKVVPGGAQ